MQTELLVTGGILSVVLSAVFAAVFNPLPPKAGIVGIDLGTTYSVISLFHNGSVEVVPDDEGKVLTPSIVAFTPNRVLVGYPAKEYGITHPEAVVFDAKRLIGHRFDEETVQYDRELVPFEVVDVNGSAFIKVDVMGVKRVMSPQSIGAHILRKLKRQVEKHIGRPVQKAVLAVPADFTEEQRNATREAGVEAGLEILRIISEPTAAALAYGLQRHSAANIIVYDFGGGTLDVSLLNLEGGVFEVVAACGDEHLGGEDFNKVLIESLLRSFKDKTGLDASKNTVAVDILRREVEAAKISLSSLDEVKISIPKYFNGLPLEQSLSREAAEAVWNNLFARALWPVEQVLAISQYSKADVDEIVLVGGTTRMPRIRQLIKEYFDGKEPNWRIDPDQAVAWGTAIQAGTLTDAKGIKVAATEYWGTGAKKCEPLTRLMRNGHGGQPLQ